MSFNLPQKEKGINWDAPSIKTHVSAKEFVCEICGGETSPGEKVYAQGRFRAHIVCVDRRDKK